MTTELTGTVEEAVAVIRKTYIKFLAFFRLSEQAVCTASVNMGEYDYHDYSDSTHGEPWHMILLTCKRCGKRFYI